MAGLAERIARIRPGREFWGGSSYQKQRAEVFEKSKGNYDAAQRAASSLDLPRILSECISPYGVNTIAIEEVTQGLDDKTQTIPTRKPSLIGSPLTGYESTAGMFAVKIVGASYMFVKKEDQVKKGFRGEVIWVNIRVDEGANIEVLAKRRKYPKIELKRGLVLARENLQAVLFDAVVSPYHLTRGAKEDYPLPR
ncbi:MAG TPA: hypothetical protein VFD45_00750 [Patescibacteria group bacterium]|nr:hypothetical protein [Patescibacteria group bacterium]